MKYSINDKNTVASFVKSSRTELKLSQQELADKAGLSFSFVNQVERGKETVRLDALNKLLFALGYIMAPSKLAQPETKPRRKEDWLSFD